MYKLGIWFEEREQAENQARAIQQRLAAVTSTSADAIITLNEASLITSWNKGAKLIFGYEEDFSVKKPLTFLFEKNSDDIDRIKNLIDKVHTEKIIRNYDAISKTVNGKNIHIEITATLLDDESVQPQGISVIIRDITQRKKREEQIQKLNESLNQQVIERTQELAEKVQELANANLELQKQDQIRSEFVSLVSHQIRSPLANMQGAVDRMKSQCNLQSPTCHRMSTIIEAQITRIDTLVHDVLNAARVEAGDIGYHLEPISLEPLINQLAQAFSTRKNPRDILIEFDSPLPLVLADKDRLAEVINNLIDNADKYAPEKSRIHIGAKMENESVIITVRDFGQGLPEHALTRVFDKFYRIDSSDTQKSYGYGLGLYVCKMLIEAQGGNIWASNHPHGGALFSFSLPVWEQPYE